MNKKLARFICVTEMILAVVMYFVIANHFDTDKIIMKILPHTDFEATMLRLSIYIVPGISIIAGFFGTVFATRGILVFAGIMEVFNGFFTLYFEGRSQLMHILGIAMIVLGALFILLVLTCRDLKDDEPEPKKEGPKTRKDPAKAKS